MGGYDHLLVLADIAAWDQEMDAFMRSEQAAWDAIEQAADEAGEEEA